MKQLKILGFAVVIILPIMAGCGQPGSGDKPQTASPGNAAPDTAANSQHVASRYDIVSSRATSKLNVIEVRVSPGSPNASLAQWSREIMQKNENKKNVQINFYDAEPNKNS